MAVKYGAEAMQVTSPDKPLTDGSIIMTASGVWIIYWPPSSANLSSLVAGMRSGAGSADCKSRSGFFKGNMFTLTPFRQR